MSGEVKQKLKILYLMKILLEETDEEHPLVMAEIINRLAEYGIKSERKCLYDDIEQLRFYGLDIIGEARNRTFYYHVGARQFELAELKLLVDSVQSARFISEKKSNALIKKIEGLTSHYEAVKLQTQVFVTERVKSNNEQILYNIDSIHHAIAENSEITFKYYNWNEKKKAVARHGGKQYRLSPWALTTADDNYYLITFDKDEDNEARRIKYFRVDKMLDIQQSGEPRKGKEYFKRFDVAAYAKKRFSMYDGEEMSVRLRCKNEYAGVIIDRFGKDITIIPDGAEYFKTCVDVAMSNQFIAWVLSMNDGIRIVGPDEVVEKVKSLISSWTQAYK